MKNYKQEGHNLDIAAPYAVTSGQGVQVGAALFGVAATDAAQDAVTVMVRRGVFALKKKTTDVMALGAVLYWDNVAKELTVTAGANLRAGVCVAAAAANTTTVDISIND